MAITNKINIPCFLSSVFLVTFVKTNPMKKLYILLLSLLFLADATGQVFLTYQNNCPVAGDTSILLEIVYVEPGNAGENLVWDFSGIRFTGKSTYSAINSDPAAKTSGHSEKSFVDVEDGVDYNYLFSENSYSETDYGNASKKMSVVYSDPIVRMKYPFVYGHQFSDHFSGEMFYNRASRAAINGDYTVTADAFGTLVLPDRILKNTLRVKAVKQSLQEGVCGSCQCTHIRYYWYAPGYRYPVLMISHAESRYGIKEPVIINNGWVNTDQKIYGSRAHASETNGNPGVSGNLVIVFPNPFSEQATYNYLLSQQMPVMVELYDISGRFNITLERKQLQPEGLHSGTINASALGLPPGVYYLRFTFDMQVLVSKIIRM